MDATKPIGIFGGTFDPVHYGHLQVAIKTYKQLDLAEIKFIPCNQSPHKNPPLATAKQRITMLQLAIKKHPEFTIDQREIQRGSNSYMYDTLASLRKDYPDTPLCLIMSQDAFAKFDSWHKWRDILNLAHLVVANRPGCVTKLPAALQGLVNKHEATTPIQLHENLAGRIQMITIPPIDVSATEIRTKCQQHQDITSLTPPAVTSFIASARIYISC